MDSNLYLWLVAALVLLCASLFVELKHKNGWSLLLLTLAGFLVYLFAAQLCPFLNLWDEQYHAVVARNCMRHPFAPAFYEDAVVPGHDYLFWCHSGVWLHKQPLFLWQIALSFRIFGVNEFALRFPSVLMSTLLIPMTYRMAKLLTQNRLTAYLTAVATASSWFLIRLVSGIENTDHNDVCFVFYVTASCWALFEYLHSERQNIKWVCLVGLFSGAAVLTKWLVGLLVFLVWGVFLLAEYKLDLKSWKFQHFLLALGVLLLVALPWQIYAFIRFPDAYQAEMLYNVKHLHVEVEDHNGSFWYFFNILPLQYFGHGYRQYHSEFQCNIGVLVTFVSLISGFFILLRRLKKKSYRFTILFVVSFVFLFFTAASTKMPAFTFILCSIGFMSIASLLSFLVELIQQYVPHRWASSALILLLVSGSAFYQTNCQNISKGFYYNFVRVSLSNKAVFKSWKDITPENCIVFNLKKNDGANYYALNASASFYSDRPCYYDSPSYEVLKDIQSQGFTVAVVDDPSSLSEETMSDESFIHLPADFRGF